MSKKTLAAEKVCSLVEQALEDLKGLDIRKLDVQDMTTITDYMYVVTGSSDRHARALAQSVTELCKNAGIRPRGIEGEGEWTLVDLGDVVVHIMLARTRAEYQLEKLWTAPAAKEEKASARS